MLPLLLFGSSGPVKSMVAAPGTRTHRPWDGSLLREVRKGSPGTAIEFELPDGQLARGVIEDITPGLEEAHHVAGSLHAPGPGRFFFQRQRVSGLAGKYSGVVEFPGTSTAYRVEPGNPGESRLVKRRLDEVLCTSLAPQAVVPGAGSTKTVVSPADFPVLPPADYQSGVPSLQSLPGAAAVVYLDFTGGFTPRWGGIRYERSDLTPSGIKELWIRVAEDFLPFEINITTDLRVYEAAQETRRQRIIFTHTTTAHPNSGGVAYIGSFNWGGDYPAWVFLTHPQECAEAASHEIGHTLGLYHDGQERDSEWVSYYYGHFSEYLEWAPIMGCAYTSQASQWSRGEYEYANNLQDDLAVITDENNEVAFREDDTGETFPTSRWLMLAAGGSARGEGVIERTADVDSFAFETLGGRVEFTAMPAAIGPNLALAISLTDSNGSIIVETNDPTVLSGSISADLPAGVYLVKVRGVGRADPLNSGFSDYASLGYYSITGQVSNPRLPTLFTLPENARNGDAIGTLKDPRTPADTKLRVISGTGRSAFRLAETGALTLMDASQIDFETLSHGKSSPPALDLFVEVVDLESGTIIEPHRRVVIEITDAPEAIPPPTTLEPLPTRAGLVLRLNSVAQVRYELQTIERLSQGYFWSPLEEKPGVDGSLEFLVPQDIAGNFFRVRAY